MAFDGFYELVVFAVLKAILIKERFFLFVKFDSRRRIVFDKIGIVLRDIRGVFDRAADNGEKNEDYRKLDEQRQAAGKLVVAVGGVHFLYLHHHLLVGGAVGSALIFFADSHFHRADLCHFYL